jgi:hypothetical protein
VISCLERSSLDCPWQGAFTKTTHTPRYPFGDYSLLSIGPDAFAGVHFSPTALCIHKNSLHSAMEQDDRFDGPAFRTSSMVCSLWRFAWIRIGLEAS